MRLAALPLLASLELCGFGARLARFSEPSEAAAFWKPLAKLRRLASLTLSECCVAGVPAAIARLSALRSLRLLAACDELDEPDLTQLSSMTRLTALALEGCGLSKPQLPAALAALTGLQVWRARRAAR